MYLKYTWTDTIDFDTGYWVQSLATDAVFQASEDKWNEALNQYPNQFTFLPDGAEFLADNSVSTDKLQDDSVTFDKIADNAVWTDQMLPWVVQIAEVTIPSASVLQLNTTPFILVNAGWPWFYFVVDSITASMDFNSIPYTINTTLEFRYNDWTGTKVTWDITWIVWAAADAVETARAVALTNEIQQSIVAFVPWWDPLAWDSDIKVKVAYRVYGIT